MFTLNAFGYHITMSPLYRTLAVYEYHKGKDWCSIILPFGVLTIETIESWERVY